MGGPIGIRTHDVQQHKNSENKWKKDLKPLNNQNNMLYSIAKKSGSRHDINNIKTINSKASKQTSVSSSEDWDSDSSLAINSGWDNNILPAISKEIKNFDHVVTDTLNNYNDQNNESIDNDPTFENSGFNLSSGTSEPLPVVTVSLRGGKKHRATVVAGLTLLWYSGATNSMIKRRHT